MKTIPGAVAGLAAKKVRLIGMLAILVAGILATSCVGYYGHPYAGGYYSAGYSSPYGYGYGYPYYGYPYYGGPYGYGGAAVVINSGGYHHGYGDHYHGGHYYAANGHGHGNYSTHTNAVARPPASRGAHTRSANPRTQATQPQ